MKRLLLLKLIIITAFICLSDNLSAQKGNYIHFHGLYQYSSLANRNDLLYSSNAPKYHPTIYPGFTFTYVNNSFDIFGTEFGIGFSSKGQKYSGIIDFDANTNDTGLMSYTSDVKLNLLHFPLLLRLNSRLDEDVVFLTISAGVQIDYLINASMNVSPAPEIAPAAVVNIKDLFNNTNVSFVSNAIFSWKFSDQWLLNFGMNMNRSMFNIERRGFPFDKNLHPVEYYFPVSTKKEIRPALDDIQKRQPSRLINYSAVIGFSYQFMPMSSE